jgi:hypothetical protein
MLQWVSSNYGWKTRLHQTNHDWPTPEEVILSGTYNCAVELGGDGVLLGTIYTILVTIWEILALCLSGWITVKHFRDLQQVYPAGGMIGDCFRVLIKSHLDYFARWAQDHKANEILFSRWNFAHTSFFAVSCFSFGYLFPLIQTVCRSLIYLCVRAWLIILIGPIFPGSSDLSWRSSNFCTCTIFCARTTPNSQRSRVSRWARGQLRFSDRHDFNCLSGARSCDNQQYCVTREDMSIEYSAGGNRTWLHTFRCGTYINYLVFRIGISVVRASRDGRNLVALHVCQFIWWLIISLSMHNPGCNFHRSADVHARSPRALHT